MSLEGGSSRRRTRDPFLSSDPRSSVSRTRPKNRRPAAHIKLRRRRTAHRPTSAPSHYFFRFEPHPHSPRSGELLPECMSPRADSSGRAFREWVIIEGALCIITTRGTHFSMLSFFATHHLYMKRNATKRYTPPSPKIAGGSIIHFIRIHQFRLGEVIGHRLYKSPPLRREREREEMFVRPCPPRQYHPRPSLSSLRTAPQGGRQHTRAR